MYKPQDRKTLFLFPELFPFGGKLNENNRWLRVTELIPWEELEDEYRKHFSDVGRPAKDAHLVIGLLLLKHMTGLSDEGVVEAVAENPYMQAFCGFSEFLTEETLDSSTLSKLRERLGKGFFEMLERKTYRVLIERKIIKAKGMLVDATVFPESIKYPNDVGLLNTVREWLVENIKKIGKVVGKKKRTYSRKAKQAHLRFSKNRTKTKKAIAKAKKAMLQYVRRNLWQMKEIIRALRKKGLEVKSKLINMLKTAEEVYSQQLEMYRKKVHRVAERIVSFHRPYVRPIKRGKQGKEVEFGGKGALVHVDGFLFLDRFEHRAFAEEKLLRTHLQAYQERFGKMPSSVTADSKYGTRANRRKLSKAKVRAAFRPLGRRAKKSRENEQWFRKKQKERNRIEGSFGHGKEHFGLDRVKYTGKDGSEIWVRCGLLAMNLMTAMKRA